MLRRQIFDVFQPREVRNRTHLADPIENFPQGGQVGAVDILKLHEIAVLMVYKLAWVVFCLGRNLIRPD